VQLPAAINFAHYTHGTGQVRSNTFVDRPWQLREFKTNINTKGEAVFVADSLLLMMVCKFELVALAVLSLALESD
jgi:hypothetical protein